LRNKKVRHSSFAILFCFLYAPVRFALDFFRSTDLPNSDVRYSGLTPAQYGSLILLCAGTVLLLRLKKEERYSFISLTDEESERPGKENIELEEQEKSP